MGWGLHTGDCMGWCIHEVGVEGMMRGLQGQTLENIKQGEVVINLHRTKVCLICGLCVCRLNI